MTWLQVSSFRTTSTVAPLGTRARTRLVERISTRRFRDPIVVMTVAVIAKPVSVLLLVATGLGVAVIVGAVVVTAELSVL